MQFGERSRLDVLSRDDTRSTDVATAHDQMIVVENVQGAQIDVVLGLHDDELVDTPRHCACGNAKCGSAADMTGAALV